MNNEIGVYRAMNELAKPEGSVIFGSAEDRCIPLCELKETFGLQGPFYNRSLSGLRLADAPEAFDACAAPLRPKAVYLHLGGTDLALFGEDPAAFDRQYSRLLRHIREKDAHCTVTVVSLRNPEADPVIHRLNALLEVTARNTQCAFFDLEDPPVWDPRQTRDVVSFLYSTGFVRSLRQNRPVRDIAKILFCCPQG